MSYDNIRLYTARPIFLGMLLVCALWSAPLTRAVEFSCPGGGCCLNDIAPSANCTAGDLTFVLAGLGVTDNGCTSPTDTISILLRAIVENNTAQTRYDVGIWVATDGDPNNDGARTGVCARESLNNPSGVISSTSCTDLDLTCGTGPYYDADLDACGDLLVVTPDCGQVDEVEDPLDGPCTALDGLADPSVIDFAQAVTFPCTDSEPDGLVNVDICLSYGNQNNQVDFGGSNGTCDSAAELEPGTNAKCQCEDGFNTNIPVPDMSLSCTCSGGTIPGGFTECTVTMANSDRAACTPDLTLSEPYRCGTAAYMRFEADYDESNLSIASSSTLNGSTTDSGTVLTWNPQSGAGTANIIGEGESGTMTARIDVDSMAPTGTYAIPVTTVWSLDSAFTNPMPQSLNTECNVVVAPTWALVSDFGAREDRGVVVVEWQTSAEAGTLGFHLERRRQDSGTFEAVHPHLLAAASATSTVPGGIYRVVDPTANRGRAATYRLVEVTADGGQRPHGPWTVEIEPSTTALEIPAEGSAATPHRPSAGERTRLAVSRAEAIETLDANLARKLRPRRLKIEVETAGLHQVDAAQIADAMGFSETSLGEALLRGAFRLLHHGEEVAWEAAPGGTGLRFFAEGLDNPYTRTDVYWLERRRGLVMTEEGGPGPSPAPPGKGFNEVLHLELDLLPRPFAATDPQQDFWFWDLVLAGNPNFGRRSLTLSVPAVALTGEGAQLGVNLWGFADEDQRVRLWLNGAQVGEFRWTGAGPRTETLDLAPSALRRGMNTVEIEGLEGSFFVDSFDVGYRRLYHAEDDALLLLSETEETVTVEHFSSADITVYNLANPQRPQRVRGVTVDEIFSVGYRVSFRPTAQVPYLAVAAGGRKTAVALRPDLPSDLRSPANVGEYLVLAPASLLEPAHALAEYRERQRLESLVVDVEDVYDEFSYGLRSPEAIGEFLAWAAANWQKPPRYVVLLGDGNFDYKNLLGLGGNLLPPRLQPTSLGLIPADNQLAPSAFSGAPTMAIGRIPALTAAEAFAYVEKLKAYETGEDPSWKRRLLAVADNRDSVGDYPADSERVLAGVHPSYFVERAYLNEPFGLSQTRLQVLHALEAGVDVLSYSGHGGLDRFASEGLLKNGDAAQLDNGDRLPVVVGLSCFLNYYVFPGFQSVGEEFTLAANSGAIAVWAAAGLTGHHEVTDLGVEFLQRLGEHRRLGDLVLETLGAYGASGGNPELLDNFNLLGDPALRLRRVPLVR